MAGKPISGFAWCAEATYPGAAGLPFSWSDGATAIAPSPDYFTPKTRPPAQPLNYLFQQAFATISAAFGWTGNMAAQNFGAEQSFLNAGTGPSIYNLAAMWDPGLLKWVVAVQGNINNPNTYVFTSYGMDGRTPAAWTQIGAVMASATSGCLVPDPSTLGNYWWIWVADDGTNNGIVQFWKWNGTSWSMQDSIGLLSTGSQLQKPRAIVYRGDIVAAIGNNRGGHATNINPIIKRVIAGFANLDPGFAANDFLLGVTPGNVLIIVPAFTLGSLTFGQFSLSLDGITFTDESMSTIIGSNDQIVGLCSTQDITGACLLLAVFNTVSLKTRFYRTADGIVWSSQSTPSTIFEVSDLAACGALVVATLFDASSGGPSGTAWSPDGGVTWYFGEATFTSNALQSATYYERPRVVSSGQGFMTFNGNWFRHSLLQGSPPNPL